MAKLPVEELELDNNYLTAPKDNQLKTNLNQNYKMPINPQNSLILKMQSEKTTSELKKTKTA